MSAAHCVCLLHDGPCVGEITTKGQSVRRATDETDGLDDEEETNDES